MGVGDFAQNRGLQNTVHPVQYREKKLIPPYRVLFMKKVTGVKSLARPPAAQLKINLGMGVLVRNNKGAHNGEDTPGEQYMGNTTGNDKGGTTQRGMTRDGN